LQTTVAAISTRDIEQSDMDYSGVFTKVEVPEAYRVDAKPFIERPFFLTSTQFRDTDVQFDILNCTIRQLPGDVVRSNTSIQEMFKIAALGRPDLVLNVSMAGTIAHAGCILVGIVPPMPFVGTPANPWTAGAKPQLINTILSGPHAFLHANEASSVNLRVPWYCNFDMMSLDMQVGTNAGYNPAFDLNYVSGNYGTLVLMVMNKLTVAEGGSTTINIVVEACFKNFDMVVPTPRYLTWTPQARRADPKPRGFIDSAKSFGTGLFDYAANGLKTVAADGLDAIRGWIKSLTGLHNPNFPIINNRIINTDLNFLNNTSTPQFFEKLDMNPTFSRVVKEPIFGNMLDEMSCSNIVSKKQYIGTFEVKTTDAVGVLKWARPISPYSGGKKVTRGASSGPPPVPGVDFRFSANNLDLMYAITRAWRGGLKVYIQSVMNNKQQVKLKLIKYYNPSSAVLANVPNYGTIVNAPSHLLEFTQGGQMHEVSLPYLARNELMPCHDDLSMNALMHGIYYIYVAQPLVVSDSSPTSAFFNVYIEGDKDLAFYGQNIRHLYNTDWNLFNKAPVGRDTLPDEFVPESGNSITVMNEPQVQDNEITHEDKNAMADFHNRLIPLVDIRPIIRRMYPIDVTTGDIPPATTTQDGGYFYQLDLASLVGERYRITSSPVFGNIADVFELQPGALVSRMYYGKSAGFKVRFEVKAVDNADPENYTTDLQNLEVVAYYVPPQPDYVIRDFQPFFQSTTALTPETIGYELPISITTSNVVTGTASRVLEFEVPFTSIMKFVGGPDKFLDLAEGLQFVSKLTANSDLGNVQVVMRCLHKIKKMDVRFKVYVGCNDETRFGNHCIAPPFYLKPSASFYVTAAAGTPYTPAPPSDTPKASIYVGGIP
jgi:hypothetical protein